MSKHVPASHLYNLPSGNKVHPCRLIQRDGTLMWKHALLYNNELNIPTDQAVESHIIKTAQRLEELNSWVSSDNEPWECFVPIAWYVPHVTALSQGISLFFKHATHNAEDIYDTLKEHTQEHETLKLLPTYTGTNQLYFNRC